MADTAGGLAAAGMGSTNSFLVPQRALFHLPEDKARSQRRNLAAARDP